MVFDKRVTGGFFPRRGNGALVQILTGSQFPTPTVSKWDTSQKKSPVCNVDWRLFYCDSIIHRPYLPNAPVASCRCAYHMGLGRHTDITTRAFSQIGYVNRLIYRTQLLAFFLKYTSHANPSTKTQQTGFLWKLLNQPFKDEAYLFDIRTHSVRTAL
jgi:hypothetical protein